jgi:thymidylate synthase
MKQYLDLLNKILEQGITSNDRTGIGTKSLFGEQIKFDLTTGFPAMTTKKLAWKSVVSELLWFIEGSNDERRLAEILYGTRDPSKITIWTANAISSYWKSKARFDGDVGKIYGYQWRNWQRPGYMGRVDQLNNLILGLTTDPFSRRHILMAYNPGEIDMMALPPCHMMSQYYVRNGYLSCHMYQRSVDTFLGLSFNIASYSLLTHMIAQVCNLSAYELIISMGDVHIYNNHFEAVQEQLKRQPYQLPTLKLNSDIKDINKFTMDDIELVNYQYHPTIKAEMAV